MESMEDLSRLLVEERSHSEKFKANFALLKTEYDKVVLENQRLSCELAKKPKFEQPDDILKQKLRNLQHEYKEKDYHIRSLQEKVHVLDDALREKLQQEEVYASKFATTEIALEQTKALLARLHLDASTLALSIEEKHSKDEYTHKKEVLELAEKYARSEKEKKLIAHQVIKATTKARNRVDYLQEENNILNYTISLKESLEKANIEKSELSSQLEIFKVQKSQEMGELVMQLRCQETELSRLQTRVETLERNLQETIREREVNSLSFQAAEKELAKLRTSLYEEKMKYEKIADQSKKDLDAKEQKCAKEVNELNKIIHEMKMNLEQEHEKIKRQSDKLTEHDKQLMLTQEQLRKKEIEISGQVQDVKIQTENKYRAMLEDTFRAEIEASRRSAEIESQLILERNLRTNSEAEHRKLTSQIQVLNERLQNTVEYPAERKRLEVAVELKELEKSQIVERYQELVKEKEAASSRHSISEAKMVQEMATLRDQLISTQQRLTSLQEETNIKVREMESVLKSTQEKSNQYAKLIWKLRKRLAENK